MKDRKNVKDNYKQMLSGKNKKFHLEKGKYILNFSSKLKDDDGVCRWKFYKDMEIKCKVFVKFDNYGKIIDYNDIYNVL